MPGAANSIAITKATGPFATRPSSATCIRVGNDEYARENDSFGLTTLRNRHVRIKGSTLMFRFRGKSGQEHSIALTDRKLIRIVSPNSSTASTKRPGLQREGFSHLVGDRAGGARVERHRPGDQRYRREEDDRRSCEERRAATRQRAASTTSIPRFWSLTPPVRCSECAPKSTPVW
jgi:hypothetical protein